MNTLPFGLATLGLLVAAFVADAAAPIQIPDRVTAWGKPAGGLQAGLRCRKDSQVLTPGEAAQFDVVIRNVTADPVAISYWPYGRYWGTPNKSTVELTVIHSHTGPEPRPYKSHIHPGKEFLLGSLMLGHVRPKSATTSYAPRAELDPGKYQVGADKLTDVVGLKLGTGYLDLELLK